jgi:hypothetical protein
MIYASNCTLQEATSKANSLKRDDKKLRALGYAGNYSEVSVALQFDGPGRKVYRVEVEPIKEQVS